MATLSCWLSRFWVLSILYLVWYASVVDPARLVSPWAFWLDYIPQKYEPWLNQTCRYASKPQNITIRKSMGEVFTCTWSNKIQCCAQAHLSRSKLISPDVAILFDGTKGVRSLLTENARGMRWYCISSRSARLIDFIRPGYPVRRRTLYQRSDSWGINVDRRWQFELFAK